MNLQRRCHFRSEAPNCNCDPACSCFAMGACPGGLACLQWGLAFRRGLPTGPQRRCEQATIISTMMGLMEFFSRIFFNAITFNKIMFHQGKKAEGAFQKIQTPAFLFLGLQCFEVLSQKAEKHKAGGGMQ